MENLDSRQEFAKKSFELIDKIKKMSPDDPFLLQSACGAVFMECSCAMIAASNNNEMIRNKIIGTAEQIVTIIKEHINYLENEKQNKGK